MVGIIFCNYCGKRILPEEYFSYFEGQFIPNDKSFYHFDLCPKCTKLAHKLLAKKRRMIVDLRDCNPFIDIGEED